MDFLKTGGKKNRRPDKKRKNYVRTKYGQERIDHARGGLKSIIMLVGEILLLVMLLFISYALKGNISLFLGLAALFMVYLAARGVHYGITGFSERNKRYITCKIGIGGNIFVFLCLVIIFVRGLI